MKVNLHTEKKDPTEVDPKLEMNNLNAKVEIQELQTPELKSNMSADVQMEIQKQNTIQIAEEPVELRKPSGLFSLNGHVVPASMLVWLFLVTMWRLLQGVVWAEMRLIFIWLYRTYSDDFFQTNVQIGPGIQVLSGLIVTLVSFKMLLSSWSKRSKLMYFIFTATGIFLTIRSVQLIQLDFDRFSEFSTEEIWSLFKKNLPQSYQAFFLDFLLPIVAAMAILAIDYLVTWKFLCSLGVDECPLLGSDPDVKSDRPSQKFSNWDWSLFLIVLGIGGTMLLTLLDDTVPSLQALEIFAAGAMFTIIVSATVRILVFTHKIKAHLKTTNVTFINTV